MTITSLSVSVEFVRKHRSQFQSYISTWRRNGGVERYRALFHNKYRIYLPLGSKSDKVQLEVFSWLSDNGVTVTDYRAGLGEKQIVTQRGTKTQTVKFTRLLPKPLLDAWTTEQSRPSGPATATGLMAVISRHPVDVASMSSGTAWESCMSIEKKDGTRGLYWEKLVDDVKYGTLVAYLINAGDRGVKNPLARVAIKPFVNRDDPRDVVLIAEDRVYSDPGHTVPGGFQETVDQWLTTHVPATGLVYVKNPKVYDDDRRTHIYNFELMVGDYKQFSEALGRAKANTADYHQRLWLFADSFLRYAAASRSAVDRRIWGRMYPYLFSTRYGSKRPPVVVLLTLWPQLVERVGPVVLGQLDTHLAEFFDKSKMLGDNWSEYTGVLYSRHELRRLGIPAFCDRIERAVSILGGYGSNHRRALGLYLHHELLAQLLTQVDPVRGNFSKFLSGRCDLVVRYLENTRENSPVFDKILTEAVVPSCWSKWDDTVRLQLAHRANQLSLAAPVATVLLAWLRDFAQACEAKQFLEVRTLLATTKWGDGELAVVDARFPDLLAVVNFLCGKPTDLESLRTTLTTPAEPESPRDVAMNMLLWNFGACAVAGFPARFTQWLPQVATLLDWPQVLAFHSNCQSSVRKVMVKQNPYALLIITRMYQAGTPSDLVALWQTCEKFSTVRWLATHPVFCATFFRWLRKRGTIAWLQALNAEPYSSTLGDFISHVCTTQKIDSSDILIWLATNSATPTDFSNYLSIAVDHGAAMSEPQWAKVCTRVAKFCTTPDLVRNAVNVMVDYCFDYEKITQQQLSVFFRKIDKTVLESLTVSFIRRPWYTPFAKLVANL